MVKRIRRGGRKRSHRRFKKKTVCSLLKIYHTNIRGYESKTESMKLIAKEINPDIVTLNETLYKGKKRFTWKVTKVLEETGRIPMGVALPH